jgi:flagellar basal-body rod modification protein FlgD
MSTVSTTTPTTSTNTAAAATAASTQQIAGNFDTFLQLLTTQLQNQDPLDPMDTSQFTEQLVEFASVEQQINENTNLQTLISLQQTSEDTQAMQLIGSTVTVNSTSGTLANASGQSASWNLNSPSPATGTVTITNSSGTVAFTGTTSLSAGNNTYTWNGVGNSGVTWPDGTYTIAVSATSATGSAVTVASQTSGTVTAVNTSQTPPQITVGGQSYPVSAIQSITSSSSGLSSLSSTLSTLNSNIAALTQLL